MDRVGGLMIEMFWYCLVTAMVLIWKGKREEVGKPTGGGVSEKGNESVIL